jgi:hypothetical protein
MDHCARKSSACAERCAKLPYAPGQLLRGTYTYTLAARTRATNATTWHARCCCLEGSSMALMIDSYTLPHQHMLLLNCPLHM